ncbi:MAG: hypothetical protein HY756_05575 [Nitrospirae bacterium]|nr:hypothetical protein [Nitrospirota bacterium]
MKSSSSSLKKELKEYIKEKTVKGQITCATLRKIAETLGVTYKQAGKAADDLKVKIRNCDLGCF